MSQEPSASEVRRLLDEGRTQIQIADQFGISRQRVQRIIKAGEDDRGPIERSVDALIARWGELNEDQAVKAGVIRSLANTADWSRRVNTGQGRQAGTQAAQILWKCLEDMGHASGAEELQKFLRSLS